MFCWMAHSRLAPRRLAMTSAEAGGQSERRSRKIQICGLARRVEQLKRGSGNLPLSSDSSRCSSCVRCPAAANKPNKHAAVSNSWPNRRVQSLRASIFPVPFHCQCELSNSIPSNIACVRCAPSQTHGKREKRTKRVSVPVDVGRVPTRLGLLARSV